MTVAIILGAAAWLRSPQGEGLRAWLPGAREPAVLVLLVRDRGGLASVRDAVAPERVLVAGPDALVLREGRVVATSAEAAGESLTAAGWVDRDIELWAPEASAQRTAPVPSAAPTAAEAASGLAELADRPTLSAAEAVLALRMLDAAP